MSRRKGAIVNVQDGGPFGESMSFTLVGDTDIYTRVVCLLSRACPSAVLWRIRTIVVNAVNRIARAWARSHISIEGGEVRFPAVTHNNSAPAIVVICAMIRIVASGFHANPYLVFRELGQAVFRDCIREGISPETAAALGVPTSQVAAANLNCSTAITATKPNGSAFVAFNIFENKQLAESLTANVFKPVAG